VSFARAALPWALAAALAVISMVSLARRVLPPPGRAVASTRPSLQPSPAPSLPRARVAPARVDLPPRAPLPTAATRPLERDPAPPAMEAVWHRIASLRARLDALEGDGGEIGQAAAAALRTIEVPRILEEAGISDEPFAAHLAAYRDAVADGGLPDALRASLFTDDERERLRLLDAVHALQRSGAEGRADAGVVR